MDLVMSPSHDPLAPPPDVEALIRDHGGRIAVVCRRKGIFDPDDQDVIVQTVACRALLAIDQGVEVPNWPGLLARMADHAAADLIRDRATWRTHIGRSTLFPNRGPRQARNASTCET